MLLKIPRATTPSGEINKVPTGILLLDLISTTRTRWRNGIVKESHVHFNLRPPFTPRLFSLATPIIDYLARNCQLFRPPDKNLQDLISTHKADGETTDKISSFSPILEINFFWREE